MATSDERLASLTIAGLVLNFEYGLRSSGKTSIGWGVFSIVIGAAVARSNVPVGSISIVLGVLLIGVGIYEMRARKPKAMVVSAVTLGLLALWNLGLAGTSYFLNGGVHLRSIIAGLLQAYGAYTTWTSYHVYARLRDLSDPAALEETGELVRQLTTTESGFVKFRVKIPRCLSVSVSPW